MTPPVPTKAAIRAEAERLFQAFQAAGAVPVDADILLPAETLLDLYGEDLRARAYVTADPLSGEMMLRPDFTVPVVQAHMAHGADPARYCYMGEVFRRQDHLGPRARDYLQVGYEVFDRANPAAADAEVFALFTRLLRPLNLRAATGDMGILTAAVQSLDTSIARKSALMRHIWRPARFRALLDRFSGRVPQSASRLMLLDRMASHNAMELMEQAGPLIGLRGADEIAARAEALVLDAAAPPVPTDQAAALGQILTLSGRLADVTAAVGQMAATLSGLAEVAARMARRMDELAERGIDARTLAFTAAHGQTTLEYYDGFVFSFHGANPEMPPVATGGRYDALTARLGAGRSIPAVGGVIRPALVAMLRGER